MHGARTSTTMSAISSPARVGLARSPPQGLFGYALTPRDEVEKIDCHNTIFLGFNATSLTAYPAAVPLFSKAVPSDVGSCRKLSTLHYERTMDRT